VRVSPGERGNLARLRERVPAFQRPVGPIEQGRKRFDRPKRISRERPRKLPAALVSPLGIGVEPFDGVERRVPGVPAQLGFGGIRMGDHAESAEPLHVFDDVARFPAQWIRRLRKADGDVMAALRAQLDPIEDEHAGTILWRVGLARAVAVIGEDDEVQTGAGGSRGHLVGRA